MKKELKLRLTELEVVQLDKARNYFREKTYSKTLLRIIEDFIRINNL